MELLEEADWLTGPNRPETVSNPEWRRLVTGLATRVRQLEKHERRLNDMLPLFQEARDALPAISLASAKLRGLRLDLGDRMDAVGEPENWLAMDAERQKARG